MSLQSAIYFNWVWRKLTYTCITVIIEQFMFYLHIGFRGKKKCVHLKLKVAE